MMDKKKFLHGNKTRISGEMNMVPRFTNYVVNDYTTRDGTVYRHRLDDDADFTRDEVNDNKK